MYAQPSLTQNLTRGKVFPGGYIGAYLFGFNGKEKIDEAYGDANAYDFGARLYDPRIGRWLAVDPKFVEQPSWSPYKAFLDNPITFQDPDGETEFYSPSGQWIGTDGQNNNLIAVVKDATVQQAIIAQTKQKLNYTASNNLMQHGHNDKNFFVIHKTVLAHAYDVLQLSLTGKGENREYTTSLKSDGQGGFMPAPILEGSPSDLEIGTVAGPAMPSGDVSIHSHITGSKLSSIRTALSSNALEPTDNVYNPKTGTFGGDMQDVFPYYPINIIVGKNGLATVQSDGSDTADLRNPEGSINVFGQSKQLQTSISGGAAKKMLSGRTGKYAKIFSK